MSRAVTYTISRRGEGGATWITLATGRDQAAAAALIGAGKYGADDWHGAGIYERHVPTQGTTIVYRVDSEGRGVGRPLLGTRARTNPVVVKMSDDELAAIKAAVSRENAEALADPTTAEDRKPATVSSWIRDHARGKP